MSGHAIKGGIPICLEPETASCRAQWDCGCESWGDFGESADGTCWHIGSYDDDGEEIVCTSVGRYNARNCNICNWLNDDLHATGPAESWAWGVYAYDVPLPDGAIDETWEGDYYTWDYTDPRVIGGLIGRLTVAQWADEIGLAS